MAPPPPPTAISTADAGDFLPSPTTDQDHGQQLPRASAQTAPLNEAWTAWSSSLSSRALDPLTAAAADLSDFASRHRQAALTATSDVQLAKIHAQAEQCATQALLTISEYLNRASTALDTGANSCASELQVLTATLAAIEQRISEAFAVSAIQSVGVDTLRRGLHGGAHEKAHVDFTTEEAVKVIKQSDMLSAAAGKVSRSNSHVPGLTFQSHGSSSAANAATTAASSSSIPTIPKLDLNSLDALGTPLPDLSAITTKPGSIKQQSLLSMTSNSPPPSVGSTTAASNNLDLSMLGDVSQHTTIRRKNSTISTATGATTATADSSNVNNPALSSNIGASLDDLAPPPPPPPGAPPTSSNSLPPAADNVVIPTQQLQPADPRGSVRSTSGMIPTQQPPPQPQSMAGGSVRSVHGISAPVPLYASHQPPPPQQQYLPPPPQQQQQPQYNMQYANAQRTPSPGSHMGTYAGSGSAVGSMRGGQPIGLGTGVNGGYSVPPMPLAPAQYAAVGAGVVPPRTQSAQGLPYATSGVAGYQPGPGGSIGYGYQQHQGYHPMQQQVPQPGPQGRMYGSVNQGPQQYAIDPATGAPVYYASPPGSGTSTSPQLAPAPPPPMGMSPPPQVVMARVLYPYTASEQDEMHLIPGEMIEIHILDAGAGWARGVSVADRRRAGMFPRSYVQLM